ncbi:hypothetical protein [Microbulbifer sp. Q7]|uniref:hypothetical protein n=1 Tax=Microbulbifer sp. Q7 TaxID=1785091 RepID=UPI00128FF9EA|nr:hypothetical protein [Microbulbifer sp. Q7]
MDFIAKSPRLRLSANLVLTIMIGVLSSTLSAQLMQEGSISWSLMPLTSSFWLLFIFSMIWIYLHIHLLNFDQNTLRFADDEHCVAYIRKAKLEGLAESIRKNPEKAELVDAKVFLKNLGVK